MTNAPDSARGGAGESAAGSATNVPTMAQIRSAVDAMVPFNRYVGVEIVDISREGATGALQERNDLLNHVGTIHAGALFLLAEATSAAAFSGAMAPKILEVELFLLRSSQLSYHKPARQRIEARSIVDLAVVGEVLDSPTPVEKFELTAESALTDQDGIVVVTASFGFYCRMRQA